MWEKEKHVTVIMLLISPYSTGSPMGFAGLRAIQSIFSHLSKSSERQTFVPTASLESPAYINACMYLGVPGAHTVMWACRLPKERSRVNLNPGPFGCEAVVLTPAVPFAINCRPYASPWLAGQAQAAFVADNLSPSRAVSVSLFGYLSVTARKIN